MNIVVLEAENDREHQVMVAPMDHVSQVKVQMQNRLGIPARRQALYFNNNELMDNTELGSLGVDNARITLVINLEQNRFNVIIKIMTSEITVEVEEMDCVGLLKHKIYQRIVVPYGQQLVLHYEGAVMAQRRRLCEYGVDMNSEIIATYRSERNVQNPRTYGRALR